MPRRPRPRGEVVARPEPQRVGKTAACAAMSAAPWPAAAAGCCPYCCRCAPLLCRPHVCPAGLPAVPARLAALCAYLLAVLVIAIILSECSSFELVVPDKERVGDAMALVRCLRPAAVLTCAQNTAIPQLRSPSSLPRPKHDRAVQSAARHARTATSSQVPSGAPKRGHSVSSSARHCGAPASGAPTTGRSNH